MKINARDWVFEVSPDPTSATPVWSTIGGVNTFTLSNSEGEESTDTTDFESNGNAESVAMQRGAALTVEGHLVDADAGQVAADDLAQLVGDDSLGGVRFRHSSSTEWTVWTAWASKGDNGGGNNDKTSWGATFTRSGAATTAALV